MDDSGTSSQLVLAPALSRRAPQRGTVRSNSVAQLQVEIQLLTHAPAPQAPLAVPDHWRKEQSQSSCVPPPCEIVFDPNLIDFRLQDDDDDDWSCTDDSVPGSCYLALDSSSSSSSSSSKSSRKGEDEGEEESCAPVVAHVVPSITEAQLSRQLQTIAATNSSPCRVQGICQQWQALCLQDESFALTLLQHGGMEALLDAMVLQKDCSQVQQAACWVLEELLTVEHEREAVQEWFGECGGMEAILRGMTLFPEHAGVQQAACAVLRSWTWNHTPSQELLVSTGLDTILTALQNHPIHAGVQQEACAVLQNLLENGGQSERIQKAGGLQLVLDAMETHVEDPAIQESACGALFHLVDPDVPTSSSHSTRAERLIRNLLDRHSLSSQLQDLGNEVLGKLLSTTPLPIADTNYQTPPIMGRKSMTPMESPTEVKAIFQMPGLPS